LLNGRKQDSTKKLSRRAAVISNDGAASAALFSLR
jgi:hypothetical protein